jgi:hypothetical protein
MPKILVHVIAFSSLLLALPAAAQMSTPPDVVRLHDGTFLRGTLVERSPTQVVLLLPTGETRTWPAAEVEHAGPDTPQVPAVVPAPVVAQQPMQVPPIPAERVARLRVRSAQEGLSLQRLQGTTTLSVWTGRGTAVAQVDQFGVVCNAPCDIEVPEGTYQLGIAQGTGNALRAGAPMDLRGDMTLSLSYDDRSLLRAMGWLTFGLGAAGGGALMIASIFAGPSSCSYGYCSNGLSIEMMIAGGVVLTGSMIAAMVLIFMQDAPVIDVIEPDGSIRF